MLTDINHDRVLDLVVGVNDGAPIMLTKRTATNRKAVLVRLAGPKGNRQGVGARITLITDNGTIQTGEVTCGSGYLSQSTSLLYFSLLSEASVAKITVQWPDGNTKAYEKFPTTGDILLSP